MRLESSVAANAGSLSLLEVARSFLDLAREEMAAGYEADDYRRTRDAAEKAWLAATQAVDHSMQRHGLLPEPGAMAHHSRNRFLEKAGRSDLSEKLSFFADQLHGRIFYAGDIPERRRLEAMVEQVAQFVRDVTETV